MTDGANGDDRSPDGNGERRSDADGPPRLARWLLRKALADGARSAVVGDLDEEFTCYVQPRIGTRRARRWYWDQTWRSIVACRLGLPDPPLHPERPTLRLALTEEREAIVTDIRYALRQLATNPLLSAIVIAILALGIGANTAVFSVINALLLRPLPVANADRLVWIAPPSTTPGNPRPNVSYAAYQALVRDGEGFDHLAATGGRRRVAVDDGSVRALVTSASGTFFETLGVKPPALGRVLTPDDDRPGATPVAVLDHGFWQRQFAGDARVLGRVIRLNDAAFTIVGIAPAGFVGFNVGNVPDVWVSLRMMPTIMRSHYIDLAAATKVFLAESGGGPWLQIVGTVPAGTPLARAQAGAAAVWRDFPAVGGAVLTSASRGSREWLSDAYGSRLAVLAGLVALVLMVGCLNVATLLGARGMHREREFGVRAALGAGRGRLLRQLLAEHLILSCAGGLAGLGLGSWLARALVNAMADRTGPLIVDLSLDRRVLLFTIVLAMLTALASGLAPALQAARVDLLSALTGRAALSRTKAMFAAGTRSLVPVQVAISCVVLVAASLFARTFDRLHQTVGIADTEQVLLFDIGFDERYHTGAPLRALLERIRDEASRLPGVERAHDGPGSSVGLSTMRPLTRVSGGPVIIVGVDAKEPIQRAHRSSSSPAPPPPPPPPPKGAGKNAAAPRALPTKPWMVGRSLVTPGFFQALGLSIVQGRDFGDADRAGAAPVAIINETLARRAFPKQNPIGRRLQPLPLDQPQAEIIGVVSDLKYEHLRDAAPDAVFFPLAQSTWESWDSDLTLVVRTTGDPSLLAAHVREAIQAIDARLPIAGVSTLEEDISSALVHERLAALLATTMGGLALVLAIAGIYGVVSYAVARRTREMGVRLALGATPGSVRLMVIREIVVVVAIGLIAGLPLANILTRYVRHLLYGVEPSDPVAMLVAVGLLFATALIAASLPALRASRVDPVIALRTE